LLKSLKKLFTRAEPSVAVTNSVHDDDFRQLSFTFAVIALSARIACLDGPLTPEKYIAFRESFPLQGGICGKIRSLFALACENKTPYTHYVMLIKHTFPGRQDLFLSLLERLFRIATTDGTVSLFAEQMLRDVAKTLDIGAADYARISNDHNHMAQAERVLGLGKRVSPHTLKERYIELMRRYHPDRFSGDKLSPEVEMLLKLKASEINEAYRVLRKKAA